nr:MAG TPA: hypothetical protein [Caudoviricetes sp.]
MKIATPGGLKIFSTKIVEKFFFQKTLKTRFSVENTDLRGYQKKHIKFFSILHIYLSTEYHKCVKIL